MAWRIRRGRLVLLARYCLRNPSLRLRPRSSISIAHEPQVRVDGRSIYAVSSGQMALRLRWGTWSMASSRGSFDGY